MYSRFLYKKALTQIDYNAKFYALIERSKKLALFFIAYHRGFYFLLGLIVTEMSNAMFSVNVFTTNRLSIFVRQENNSAIDKPFIMSCVKDARFIRVNQKIHIYRNKKASFEGPAGDVLTVRLYVNSVTVGIQRTIACILMIFILAN